MNILKYFFNESPSEEKRVVWINREQEMKFKTNAVKTSKFTIYNFFFKSVLTHFLQPLYIYFLMMAILQSLPSISSTNGVPTLIVPILVVLVIDGVKDAYEDWHRHVSDRTENNRKVFWIYKGFELSKKASEIPKNKLGLGCKKFISSETLNSLNLEWKLSYQLEVGDIILLSNREEIPADVILLTSSEQAGAAFVETMCLDGETNLKRKESVPITQSFFTNDLISALEQVKNWEGCIVCHPPNIDLNKFEGTLIEHKRGEVVNTLNYAHEHSIGLCNILMRGCILRNTVWALGVVIYTGHDTKIYMNMSPPKIKASNLDILTNKIIILSFIVQIIFALVAAFLNLYYYLSNEEDSISYLDFLYKDISATETFYYSFFTWISITCNIIPISALVTMNLVRLIQGYLMSVDKSMYYAEVNTHTVPRNTNVNDLLGQIKVCFSDKTGTLTCNRMTFRKFAMEGVSYGKGLTDIRRSHYIKNGIPVPNSISGKYVIVDKYINLVDDHILDDLRTPSSPRHVPLIEFCLHMTLNNGIVTEYINNAIVYSSTSPDESTFAWAAKSFGITLLERNPLFTTIDVLGKKLKVKVLVNIEFDNERRLSSSICAFPRDPSAELDYTKPALELAKSCRVVLFTKGSESTMLKLINKRSVDDKTLKYMKEYSNDGLRIICFAKRELSYEEFSEWYQKYHQAEVDISDRHKKCVELIEELEQGMRFQGITAVEDKLQDGVAESIDALSQAGIKTWMLTGDNLDSALNIGLAINLIYSDSDKIDLTSMRISSDMKRLSKSQADDPDIMRKLYRRVLDESLAKLSSPNPNNIHRCMLIDGESISVLVGMKSEIRHFIDLCMMVNTAIGARMTPKNKGDLVSLFSDQNNMVTLAIGDGANDCNMIQRADVGVGIKGNEGAQAFNVSDYGIAQFRFLVPLLLFHGRLTYRRMSKLIMYLFYKNILLVGPVWVYGVFSMFSGQTIYNDMMQQVYNIFFTSIPPIIFGSIEQDVDRRLTLKYPQLYKLGHINFYMNAPTFLMWILNGVFQSVIIIVLAYLTFGGFTVGSGNGETYSLPIVGYAIFTIIFIVANVKLLLETYYVNVLTFIGLFISVFGFVYVATSFSLSPHVGLTMRCMLTKTSMDLRFWLFCFVCTMACIYRDYVWKVYLYSYRSRLYQFIQTVEYK